jgi:Asp-tRNA(Asn)/Glu-tRNA(Gln) amidotransferase A subunit family amidase
VQLIAAPWREDLVLRAAWRIEQAGAALAPLAPEPEPAGVTP